jgi:hypothetical protein
MYMGCIHGGDASQEATNQVGFKVAVSRFLVGWSDDIFLVQYGAADDNVGMKKISEDTYRNCGGLR